tara:strand:- start:610 stop:1344 length:735 start_codon:yes stop_codon:yes gene_type:complete
MKFSYIIIIFFLFSCTNGNISYNQTNTSNLSKGFALIYNETDYKNKIISSKLNSEKIQVAHNKFPKNSILLITNPVNKKSVKLVVSKKMKYHDFYKVVITKKLSDKIGLDPEMPFVEIEKRIKNKSFIAKKAVTYSEEKNVLIKAPVTKVKINDISQSQTSSDKPLIKNKYSIIIGSFYEKRWAYSLIEILLNENIEKGAFRVNKLGKNNYQLLTGPYTSINTLKSDYFKLNKYGFDSLDIKKH